MVVRLLNCATASSTGSLTAAPQSWRPSSSTAGPGPAAWPRDCSEVCQGVTAGAVSSTHKGWQLCFPSAPAAGAAWGGAGVAAPAPLRQGVTAALVGCYTADWLQQGGAACRGAPKITTAAPALLRRGRHRSAGLAWLTVPHCALAPPHCITVRAVSLACSFEPSQHDAGWQQHPRNPTSVAA